jgi:creatinine amidohydrolase
MTNPNRFQPILALGSRRTVLPRHVGQPWPEVASSGVLGDVRPMMRFEELTSPEAAALDRDSTVLVLPLGSVEQHGHHMPLGTDTLLAHAVSLRAAERFAGKVLVLPPPWYGFSAHHMAFAGSITLKVETLMAVAEDVVGSLVHHGFRRILIVNGHGGNGPVIDLLAATLGHRHYGAARIAALTYFQLARDAIAALRQSRPGGMGHACEFETAMIQHLRPDLVRPGLARTTYPDPGSRYLTTDLLGGSAIRTYLDFRDLSDSGTLGDPSLATPEKGAAFFDAVVDALVAFIGDFRGWPIAEQRT